MASSSSPSPSTIADPKPKCPNPASSSSTTTSTPPPPGKRTLRDQPNLSDCHCCGRRVNYTNPKDRLQPLDSVWRVVLLCRKCRKNFRSGKTCPYCFQESTNPGGVFTCLACERKIHKDCVWDYGNCTPWCYLAVGGVEGFRVCVDCWVPESLKGSIRVCGSESKGGVKGKGKGEGKDASFENNAVGLANCASARKDKDSSKAENSNSGGAVEAVDDAELAIQLHRVMNSSPRILRGKCSLNSDGLAVLNIRDWKGLSYKRSRLGKNHGKDQKQLGMCSSHSEDNEIMDQRGEKESCVVFGKSKLGLRPYKRDRKRKIWQFNHDNTVVSECSRSRLPAELNFNMHLDDQNHTCLNVDIFGQELVTYKRSRFKRKANEINGLARVSGESSSCFQSDGAHLRTENLVKRDNYVILPSGSCVAEMDRYYLKYYRRFRGTKSDSSCLPYGASLSENQASVHTLSSSKFGCCQKDNMKLCLVKSDCEVILPSGTCEAELDRYRLKYGKRVRGTKSDPTFLCYDASQSENQASAPAESDTGAFYSLKNDKLIFPAGTSNSDRDPYFFKYTKRIKSNKSGSVSDVEND